jgi:hypothetical protein
VLNILSQNGNIPFDKVSEYFQNKLEDKADTIKNNKEIMTLNMKRIK